MTTLDVDQGASLDVLHCTLGEQTSGLKIVPVGQLLELLIFPSYPAIRCNAECAETRFRQFGRRADVADEGGLVDVLHIVAPFCGDTVFGGYPADCELC